MRDLKMPESMALDDDEDAIPLPDFPQYRLLLRALAEEFSRGLRKNPHATLGGLRSDSEAVKSLIRRLCATVTPGDYRRPINPGATESKECRVICVKHDPNARRADEAIFVLCHIDSTEIRLELDAFMRPGPISIDTGRLAVVPAPDHTIDRVLSVA